MLKGLGNIATLMKQAQEMGGKMQEMQEQLKQQRVIGTAGAGLVEVEMNGHGEVLRLKIDPTLVAKADGEMIEDLVPAAVNQASAKAKALHAEGMKAMTGGMDLPGLDDALEPLTGGAS